MHERSLVAALLTQACQALESHGGGALREVCVEIGPLTGVERILVEEAFRELSPGTAAEGATLSVNEVPLAVRCRDCGGDGFIERFLFRCPVCGSSRVQVTGGDAFRLMSISVEDLRTVP